MFDSFILQMRGRQSGNVTYPGKWIKIPNIAKQIKVNSFYERYSQRHLAEIEELNRDKELKINFRLKLCIAL